MNDFVISVTSSVDVSREYLDNLGLRWIPFPYELDGENLVDDLGLSLSLDDFYHRLSQGSISKTSQINVMDYMAYFENIVKEDLDIIHLCLSSGITGEFNNARLAADAIMDKYDGSNILVIDSLQASSCQIHLAKEMVRLKDEGASIEYIRDYIEANKLKVNTYFMTSDLSHYIRGGRVSKPAGAIGQVLNICPILEVNNEGKLIVIDKARGKKKTYAKMVKYMKKTCENGKNYKKDVIIDHTASLDDAYVFKEMLEEAFPRINNIEIHEMGVIIGSHSGPGTIGFSYWGDPRKK